MYDWYSFFLNLVDFKDYAGLLVKEMVYDVVEVYDHLLIRNRSDEYTRSTPADMAGQAYVAGRIYKRYSGLISSLSTTRLSRYCFALSIDETILSNWSRVRGIGI